MSASSVAAVNSRTKKGTAYLEIVPSERGIVVQRTASGRTLNQFWTVWLRQLILEQTDPRHSFAVGLRDSKIFVSSSTSRQGLLETVRSIASQIHPLPNPPISRYDSVTARSVSWHIDESIDLSAVVRTIHLPPGSRVDGGRLFMGVTRTHQCTFRIGELAMMVEYQVACYCLHRKL